MLKLIPQPKCISYKEKTLEYSSVKPIYEGLDQRVLNIFNKLPISDDGVELVYEINNGDSESYSIKIDSDLITISAESVKGAFYATQTLRQVFLNKTIPCCVIEDRAGFRYRGFYHDITRGKIPTIDTLKKLIDQMAYYKYNSLQLYVEHVFEFEQTKEIVERTGCITRAELEELDCYCQQNFIDFIPSLSTFGHMYEILSTDQYKKLSVLKDYVDPPNLWVARMMHHTIDPRMTESISLVKSLIDQYEPCFTSETFNICCDETFDLKTQCGEKEKDLYVEFVKQIISHVKSKGKKIMMWADILLQHPETISMLPEDTIFLNWDYSLDPEEENVEKFSKLNREQIVCPGTWTWNAYCEKLDLSKSNICKMAEYGYKYGVKGMLVTNWGDFNNICSLELSTYGFVLGAEKSWNPSLIIDKDFENRLNFITYGFDKACDYLWKIVDLQTGISFYDLCFFLSEIKANMPVDSKYKLDKEFILKKREQYKKLISDLKSENWDEGNFKQQMLSAIQGIMTMLDVNVKYFYPELDGLVELNEWYNGYAESWLKYNKPSELYRIKELYFEFDKK